VNSTTTILIVDDEPGMHQVMEALLTPEGYTLAFAGNGAEALALAARLTPDLILLDVVMPDMNGFEVCRRLRTDPQLAEVPIVMVTANDDSDSRLQGIEAGVDDYLTKPFDRLEMRARVRSITRLNRFRRLLAERARFAWVADQSEDGYLTVNETGAVLAANSAARIHLGLVAEASAPITESFLELARKQYRPEPEEAWTGWPRVSDVDGTRYLVRPETPTAQAFWLKVDLLDLRSGAEPVWQVRLRDVSEQIASQRGLEQFHRAIVHKLRTPLVGIVGGLELLAQHVLDLSQEEVTEMTQIALRAAQRLRGEIDDILQYLRAPAIARAGQGLPLSELQPLVAEVASGLGLEAAPVALPEALETAQVVLSRRAVESMLWEMLENSRKFHPAHTPTVEIELSRLAPQSVRLRVRDNGVTLSPEQLARVWRPYYQGEKHFTGEMGGMGLGLPGVASLVWEVDGACRIYNRDDGPGVVVEIDLPLAGHEADSRVA
jgi:DNA-binding response OmpR family regulator/anti-sigma regulatory factor (Ser/Thr protein kinase)